MFDFVTVFFNDLTDQVLNPQKRVFFGYLLTSLCIAVLWLVFIEKRGIVKSFAKIFDKNIWFGQSSRGDFKILLVNRVLFSSFGTSIISQITIATLIYNFLMDQPFIAPLYFNSVNASFVVLLFTLTFLFLMTSHGFTCID